MSRSVRCTALLLSLAALLALAAGCDDEGEKGETPETACCELADQPGQGGTFPCIEGATCCSDGSWRCNEGDGQPTCDSYGGVCMGSAPSPL